MLVEVGGEVPTDRTAAVLVVEDDSSAALRHAQIALSRLHREGVSAELIATGSPRKRYDKAVKRSPGAILKFSEDGHAMSGDADTDPRITQILPEFR
jgi:histidyl-tRNA synthetase